MNRKIITLAGIFLASLGACKQSPDTPISQNVAASDKGAVGDAKPTERLLAAAEPFEMLTEKAFDAPLPAIDKMIAEASRATDSVRTLLPSARATSVDKLLADLTGYRQQDKRADIALASIEIYRIIVSSVPSGSKIPSEVSLLDYAGFRYQADLRAKPSRWADMADALNVARSHWRVIQPRLSQELTKEFESALADMEKAVKTKNASLAQVSATKELDLVDKLESYFSAI